MPVSLLTWANLNHTLCGFESDILYEIFNLGKWYWPWCELYLTIIGLIGFIVNFIIITIVHSAIDKLGLRNKETNHVKNN